MQKIIYIISIFSLVLPTAVFASSTIAAETKPVVEITYNSALVSADITPGDSPDNVYWFEWGVSGNLSDVVFKTPVRTLNSKYTRSDSYTLRGLAPSTQYYYRIVAENQTDHVAGRTIYFTTKSFELPAEAIVIATTLSATDLKDTDATLHGYVAPHNSNANYWFEWGTDRNVGEVTSNHGASRDGGEVTIDLYNLVAGTTYYYRVAAENERGVVRGAIQSFRTTGVKPKEEAPKNQTNATPDPKKGSAQSTNTNGSSGLFGSFGGSTTDNTTKKDTTTGGDTKISGSDLSGSVGSTVKDIAVSVKPIGKAGVHETIEYKVAYLYNHTDSAKKAQFEVTLPSTLVYMGDTTANELIVKEAKNGARTYVLPIGSIKKGDTRTFSILAMTTADAKGIPEVKANLVFTTKNNEQMVAGVAAANTGALFGNSSPNSTSGSGFPTTLIVWLIIINVAIASIIGMFRAKEWYTTMQARLKEEEEKAKAAAMQFKANLSGKPTTPVMVVVPENEPQPERPIIHQFEQELDSVKGEEVEEFGLPGAYTVTA